MRLFLFGLHSTIKTTQLLSRVSPYLFEGRFLRQLLQFLLDVQHQTFHGNRDTRKLIILILALK